MKDDDPNASRKPRRSPKTASDPADSNGESHGWLYVMADANDASVCKPGITTRNTKDRVRELRTYRPGTHVHCQYFMDAKSLRQVERTLKQEFAEQRLPFCHGGKSEVVPLDARDVEALLDRRIPEWLGKPLSNDPFKDPAEVVLKVWGSEFPDDNDLVDELVALDGETRKPQE